MIQSLENSWYLRLTVSKIGGVTCIKCRESMLLSRLGSLEEAFGGNCQKMQFGGEHLSLEGLEALVTEREDIVKTQIRNEAHLPDVKHKESSVEVLRAVAKTKSAGQN